MVASCGILGHAGGECNDAGDGSCGDGRNCGAMSHTSQLHHICKLISAALKNLKFKTYDTF